MASEFEPVTTILEVDGEPVLVHGDKPMNAEEQAAVATVIRAARAKMAAEPAKSPQEQARIAASRARLHERLERLRNKSPNQLDT